MKDFPLILMRYIADGLYVSNGKLLIVLLSG